MFILEKVIEHEPSQLDSIFSLTRLNRRRRNGRTYILRSWGIDFLTS